MEKELEKKLENCYNVPIYIEKAIKKLFKLKNQEKELVSQVKDYMQTHNIPVGTPLSLLKYYPQEEIDPNQIKFDFSSQETKVNDN